MTTGPMTSLKVLIARMRQRSGAAAMVGVCGAWCSWDLWRGADRVLSDAELLVRFVAGKKTVSRFLALGELLEEALGQRVERMTIESLSPLVGHSIMAEARDVLCAR